jgi:hypothetical protein
VARAPAAPDEACAFGVEPDVEERSKMRPVATLLIEACSSLATSVDAPIVLRPYRRIARASGAAGVGCCALALLGTGLPAQDDGGGPPAAATSVAAPPAHPFRGTLGVDVATQYFFRGILQEDRGVIAQPSLEVEKPLLEDGTGLLRSSALTFGMWHSLHSGPTGTRGGTDAWYEADFYAGVTASRSAASLGVTYTAYASPNGRFDTVQEVAVALGYDDGAAWGGGVFTGLRPAATVAFELNGQADAGRDLGTYLELALCPGLSFEGRRPRPRAPRAAPRPHPAVVPAPFGLSLPITLGLSLGDYYERDGLDEPFGYLDVGLAAAFSLPARLSDWSTCCGSARTRARSTATTSWRWW